MSRVFLWVGYLNRLSLKGLGVKYQIITAESEIDFDKAKKIILAYAKFLNVDLSFQNQGLGFGDALMSRFIEVARQLGYLSITLDTVPELNKAVCLYKKYSFVPVAPYRYKPHPEACFMG